MKRLDVRALRDEAYHILDESDGDVSVLQAMETLEKSPKDVEAYLFLAESSEEKERFDKALIWIDQGLIHHPTNAALLLKKASLLLDGFEEVDEAFLILTKIKAAIDNKSLAQIKSELDLDLALDVYLLLTDCYRLKNNYQEAFFYAKKAFELAPEDEPALLAIATAYFELGDYNEALGTLSNIEDRKNPSDFYWQKGQILCAMGSLASADEAFALANKIDKGRYHRPIRISQSCFFSAFEQATLALPKEIRDFMNTIAIEIKHIVPLEMIKESNGTLSPEACIFVKKKNEQPTVYLFHRNIENLALKKSDMRDLIASALLHELGKTVRH
ncbi:MAG TPA: tetratricopeptide repeat protein [Myxococcota bacterium]|nr:tetratricopeptide repeat protein [Myxococcota bacterium]